MSRAWPPHFQNGFAEYALSIECKYSLLLWFGKMAISLTRANVT